MAAPAPHPATAAPGDGAGEPSSGAPQRLADLARLIDVMGTAVAADGGTLRLVSADPDTGEVTVALSGSCSTCSVASATLEAGVERILRERLPWVTEIVGIVDSADDWEASAALGRGGWRPAERS